MNKMDAFHHQRYDVNSAESGLVAKPYRTRQLSVETGYASGGPTPTTPYTGFFEHTDEDLTAFACSQTNIEDGSVFNVDETPIIVQGVKSHRPITKKAPQSRVISSELDIAIHRIAGRLADLRMELAGWGQWKQEESMRTDQLRNGWRYPLSAVADHSSLARRCKMRKTKTYCEFCQNNDDPAYLSHQCKNAFGEVTCPILSALICPMCGATGKSAHTKRYCPLEEKVKRVGIEMNIMGYGIF